MVKTSTLIYLVDDINLPSDMLLRPEIDKILEDEYFFSLLNLLEVDPGEELVSKVLDRIEE